VIPAARPLFYSAFHKLKRKRGTFKPNERKSGRSVKKTKKREGVIRTEENEGKRRFQNRVTPIADGLNAKHFGECAVWSHLQFAFRKKGLTRGSAKKSSREKEGGPTPSRVKRQAMRKSIGGRGEQRKKIIGEGIPRKKRGVKVSI